MAILTLEEALPEALDPSWLDGFDKEMRLGWELEKANYMARQELAKEEFAKPIRNIEGLGQLIGIFDRRTYFRWLQEDEDFWNDRGNVTRFLRDNPECRAPKPVMKTRITV